MSDMVTFLTRPAAPRFRRTRRRSRTADLPYASYLINLAAASPWIRMPRSTSSRLILALAALGLARPAVAHTTVGETAKSEIVYAPDDKVLAIRHAWSFYPAYSTYV